MDRVLKYNLDLDRYAKPSPYEVNLEEKKEVKPEAAEEMKQSSEENKNEEL